jgi:hypothetical protein
MSMCFAIAASQGISGATVHSAGIKRPATKKILHKPKLRII